MNSTSDKPKFEWNDDLVLEFARFTNSESPTFQGRYADLDQFKQSKVPPLTDTKERIEVARLSYFGDKIQTVTIPIYQYKFCLNIDNIPSDKYDEVKQAIESVLNNDTNISKEEGKVVEINGKRVHYELGDNGVPNIISIAGYIFYPALNAQKTYTQSEVDTIREDLWNRCREWADGKWSNQFFPNGKNSQFKYPTLQDYLNTLNQKTFVAPASLSEHPMCKKEEPKPSPDKEVDKGWEIVSLKNYNGNVTYLKTIILAFLNNEPEKDGYYIHSVKRLSDGVVFSVGEIVDNFRVHDEIVRLGIFGDNMICDFKKTSPCNISYIKKLPPIDNTDNSDVIWFVNSYWELHSKVKDTHHPADNDKNITVKDKEAGEQYILENKPCLSLSDLLDVWGQDKFDREYSKEAPLYKDLAKIVKQKLKAQ